MTETGYFSRWTEEGTQWKQILDAAQSVAEPMARSWGAHLSRELWDTPKLDLRWYTRHIDRSIQIVIDPSRDASELHVNGSAWRDDNKRRQRRWRMQEDINIVSVPHDLSDSLFRKNLAQALKKAHEIIFKWRENDLKEVARELPQRDPDLFGMIVKRLKDVKRKSGSRHKPRGEP
jgi:hypothetical protein